MDTLRSLKMGLCRMYHPIMDLAGISYVEGHKGHEDWRDHRQLFGPAGSSHRERTARKGEGMAQILGLWSLDQGSQRF